MYELFLIVAIFCFALGVFIGCTWTDNQKAAEELNGFEKQRDFYRQTLVETNAMIDRINAARLQ